MSGRIRRSRSFSGFSQEEHETSLSRSLDSTATLLIQSPLRRTIESGIFDVNAPLPYSKYQEEPVPPPRPVPSRRRSNFRQELDRLASFQQRPRTGLPELLTPILPPWFSTAADDESASSSIASTSPRKSGPDENFQHEFQGKNFVHPESVLSRPFYVRRQYFQKEPWINRWSDRHDSNSGSASVPGLGYIPSAAAMAIISKSYTNSLTTSSWSKSVAAWQSDAESKDARR